MNTISKKIDSVLPYFEKISLSHENTEGDLTIYLKAPYFQGYEQKIATLFECVIPRDEEAFVAKQEYFQEKKQKLDSMLDIARQDQTEALILSVYRLAMEIIAPEKASDSQ